MAVATTDAESEILYRARHDRDRDGPMSETIVEALAAVENVEADELGARLYDSFDPEALDSLYETAAERAERLRLAFTIGGYEVVVADDGDFFVRERGGASAAVR
ncbi:HalOD1 output domain-containing protein [Halorussus litoreus]|uniref:HalOD1 output domain-containing protein n=1 Tax=Halorussus litoreus TaxID=1710536 RepID=UPI000E22CF8E|nr:HalOD1 output domain-containing protein [Halorussus litoreus]